MIRYVSEKQLTIEEFKTPFQKKLSADNRWVKQSQVVPWDKFANVYMAMMSSDLGRPGLSPRVVLGACLILKSRYTKLPTNVGMNMHHILPMLSSENSGLLRLIIEKGACVFSLPLV
jgi:hypothetical protein